MFISNTTESINLHKLTARQELEYENRQWESLISREGKFLFFLTEPRIKRI